MVSLFVTVIGRISCFYVLISKHFTDTQAIVYVRFSDSASLPDAGRQCGRWSSPGKPVSHACHTIHDRRQLTRMEGHGILPAHSVIWSS